MLNAVRRAVRIFPLTLHGTPSLWCIGVHISADCLPQQNMSRLCPPDSVKSMILCGCVVGSSEEGRMAPCPHRLVQAPYRNLLHHFILLQNCFFKRKADI